MKTAASFALALFVGFLGGYVVFNHPASAVDTHMVADEHAGIDYMQAHAHDPLEVPTSAPTPSVSLTLYKDAKSGYNAHITTTNIRFAPEHASGAYVAGEGHAHIYVNGVKINRVYGEWYHLADVVPGDVVSVQLSSNNHKELTIHGEAIADTKRAE
jgi:hypothetical protein